MLAVLHQLTVETVPTTQDTPAAQRFGERIDHLYPDVDSDSSWVPRAKVHYKWLVHLELAKIRSSSYVLTEIGDGVLNKLRQSTLTNGIRYRSILALHYLTSVS